MLLPRVLASSVNSCGSSRADGIAGDRGLSAERCGALESSVRGSECCRSVDVWKGVPVNQGCPCATEPEGK